MIDKAIENIKDTITALPYVERYGGLVQTAYRNGVTEEGVPFEERFPLACGVTEKQCWEGRYQDLTPNEQYKSILFFEQISDTQINYDHYANSKTIIYSAVVRLVCWLNLQKLGATGCSISSLVAHKLIEQVDGKYELAGELEGITSMFTPIGMAQKDTVFDRYSFDMRMALYPFDFFGIDYQVTVYAEKGCVDVYTPAEAIECIDLTLT